MPETIKVLTYNIQRGLSAIRRRDIVSEIVMILETSNADFVCLQEVWQQDGLDEHQLEALCERGWHHRLFGKNAVFPTGSQGNAILSRFPVERWSNVDVSVGDQEPRGFLHVKAATPGGMPIDVLCCHFGLSAAERRMQALWMQQFIASHIPPGTPVIMAGDFNDWRGRPGAVMAEAYQFSEAIYALTGKFGRTFPSFFPLLPLDRIYFRDCRLRTARIIRHLEPRTTMSDHLPVEAIFEL